MAAAFVATRASAASWSITAPGCRAINALDKTVIKFREPGAEVELIGLNAESKAIVERLAIYDKPDARPASGH